MRSFYAPWLAFGIFLSVPLRAETPVEKAAHLQTQIERASERGSFSLVQTLRLERAENLKALGRYVDAAREYELLLSARPSKTERVKFFIELGRLRDASQDYSGAISSFQDALHDQPDSWDANLALARSYGKIELNSQAIDAYKHCILLRPKSEEGYQEIAGIYQHMGYLNKAINFYQKAIKIKPQVESYLGMADCYVRQDDITHATEILQQAKTVLPRADYDVRLGDIYEKQGNWSKAAASWEEALHTDARLDDLRLKLAMVYTKLHRKTDADRLLKELMTRYPDSPLVHFLRAWILFDRGDRQGSRSEALQVERLDPTELVRHYNERLLLQLGK
jgi:tetratricopeptide (TPR) repeat protein